jgi:hypothetical protein
MARNPKVTVDVEFGKVDQREIDKIVNDVSGKLKNMELDPGWAEKFEQARRKVSEIRKEVEDARKESEKTSNDLNRAESESIKLHQKLKSLQDDRAKLTDKTADAEIRSYKLQKEFAALQAKGSKNTVRMEQIKTELKQIDMKKTESLVKLDTEMQDVAGKLTDSQNERLKLTQQLSAQTNKIRSAHNDMVGTEKTLYGLEANRLATQQLIAKDLMKADKSLSEEEALARAKKMLPLNAKQSKFEQKQFDLLKKTKKFRKNELKEKLSELKIHDTMLKQQGVGFWDRKKIMRTGQAEAKKAFKAGGKADKKGGIGGAIAGGAKGQLAGLTSAIGSLAGPLLALGSVAGFIMLMVEYNEKIMKARKSLFKMAATGTSSFKALEKGQKVTIGQVEAYRKSLYGLFNQVGMTYDDALQATAALTKQGFDLNVTTKEGRQEFVKLIASIEDMATVSGLSFDEMAGYAGELSTELKVATEEIPSTFIEIRKSAVDAGVMTSRFFSETMNAAQGLAIYGTRVEDVADAFAKLVAGVKMPQKQALQLAGSLMNANETLTSSQKTMIAMVGDAKTMLASQKNLTDEQLRVLNADYPDQLEAQTRYFEALDPGKQLELRFRALAKVAPDMFKDVDISDPKQLAKVLLTNREKLAEIGKQFGFDKKQLMLIEQVAQAGRSIVNMPEEMADAEKKADKARMDANIKEQARAIEIGTRTIKDIIMQKVVALIDNIYTWLETKLWPFLQTALEWMGKDKVARAQALIRLEEQIQKNVEKDNVLKEKESQILAKKTRTSKDEEELKNIRIERGQLRAQTEKLKAGRTIATSERSAGATLRSGVSGRLLSAVGVETAEAQEAGVMNVALVDSELIMPLQRALTTALADGVIARDSKAFKLATTAVSMLKAHPGLTELLARGEKAPYENMIRSAGGLHNASADDIAKITNLFKQTLGYARGGYTGNVGIGSPAGIVHGKEFVFDADTTRKAGPGNLTQLMTSIKSQPPMIPAKTVGAAAASTGRSVTNQVTININQRDRQEIEQIVYKVLYDQKGNEV